MRKLTLFMTILLVGFQAGAMDPSGPQVTPDIETPEGFDVLDFERRESSMFHNPKKDTAAAQFEYAKSLMAKGKWRKAGGQFLSLVHQWHESPEAPKALMAYAETLEKRGQYDDAFREYQYLVQNYGGQFDYETVLDRQFRIANHARQVTRYALWVIPYKDEERALPYFETVVANGPGWKRAPEAQFTIGLIYEKSESYALAIDAYEVVAQRFAESGLAGDADFRIGYCLYEMAKNRKYEEKAARRARAHLSSIIRRYPEHEMTADAKKFRQDITDHLAKIYYDRAVFYDEKSNRKKAALVTYRDFVAKFPEGSLSDAARERITALEADLKPSVKDPVEESAQ